MVVKWVPDRGDVVWVDLNPTRGHEQRGKRPALVLSPKIFNDKAGLILACPITSQRKGYPFEVDITAGVIQGVVLADQIRALDWVRRKAKKIKKAFPSVVTDVQQKLKALLFE
jgi:mRNA interferase MazF